jgi:hypothetical protein
MPESNWVIRTTNTSAEPTRVMFLRSWAPFASGHTRVAGGFAVTHDAIPLQPFGEVFDQSASTTQYNPNGRPAGTPVLTTYLPSSNLKLPRATNWTASVTNEISSRLSAASPICAAAALTVSIL